MKFVLKIIFVFAFINSFGVLSFQKFSPKEFRKMKDNISIDTLSIKNDTVFADLYRFDKDSVLIESFTAYLFKDTSEMGKRVVLGRRIFWKNYLSTKVIRHGETKLYRNDFAYCVEKYEYGKFVSQKYLDKEGNIDNEARYIELSCQPTPNGIFCIKD